MAVFSAGAGVAVFNGSPFPDELRTVNWRMKSSSGFELAALLVGQTPHPQLVVQRFDRVGFPGRDLAGFGPADQDRDHVNVVTLETFARTSPDVIGRTGVVARSS